MYSYYYHRGVSLFWLEAERYQYIPHRVATSLLLWTPSGTLSHVYTSHPRRHNAYYSLERADPARH
jgi:hypothetical protein